jgi:WD40 repeat protein
MLRIKFLGVALGIVMLGGHRGAIAAEDLGEPVTESPDGNPIVVAQRPFRDVAFSTDGRLLATTAGSNQNGTREFCVWDVGSWEKRCAYQTKQSTRTLSFSADGTRLTAGIFSGKLTTLDTKSGKVLEARDTPDKSPDRITCSASGAVVAISNRKDFGISLWDGATLESRGVLKGHKKYIAAMAFSEDEKFLVSCGSDHEAILWDVAKATAIRSLGTGDRSAGGVAFSPNGKYVAVASNDTNVRVYSTETGEEFAKYGAADGSAPQRLAFTRDNRLLAVAGYTPVVTIFLVEKTSVKPEDLQRATELVAQLDDDQFAIRQRATEQLARLGPAVEPVVKSALGKAPSDEARRRLQSVLAGLKPPAPHCVLTGHRGQIDAIAFSPDGKLMATASHDASVRIWDVSTGKTVATLGE